MIKKIYLPMLMGVLLAGCGGGSTPVDATTLEDTTTSTASTSTMPTVPSTTTVPMITSDFKINLADVEGYSTNDTIEDQYLSVINHLRSLSIECNDSHAYSGPSGVDMQWNVLLSDAAEEHSEDMRIAEHYAHDGSGTDSDITGQTFTPTRASKFYERIEHNGFNGSSAENIAIYASTPTQAQSDKWVTIMEAWMTSTTGHCSNIMNPSLTEFGMHESRADVNGTGWYKVYWTQNFGG